VASATTLPIADRPSAIGSTQQISAISLAIAPGASLHVVERFTRVAADTLQYEFTVDDPGQLSAKPPKHLLPADKMI